MVTTLATFVLSSCNNISGGVVTDDTNDNKESKTVTFIADSDGLFDFADLSDQKSARTIIPAALYSTSFDFYLVYKDTVNSNSYSLASITFNKEDLSEGNDLSNETDLKKKITKGSFTKAFTLSDYTFALYAVNATVTEKITADNVSTYASFVGTANADLRYGDNVTFHMKANSKSDGTGQITINLSHEDDWQIPAYYNVTVGLYNIDDNSLVYPTEGPQTIQARNENATTFPTNFQFTSSAGAVDQGEYNLVVKYEHQPEAADKTKAVYEYSEKVVVLMNQNSTGSIVIPEILEKAPDAPTNFLVQYQNPTDSSKNNYNVNFKWTDASKNEREFILEILKLSETGYPVLPANDGEWTTLETGSTKTTYNRLTFDAADDKVAGSLNKGNSTVTLSLPLEQRFVARICASNDAGQSSWAYVGWTVTDTEDTSKNTTDTGWLAFDKDVKTINRFRITYNLNGGNFTKADADGTALAAEESPALIYYASQYTNTTSTPAASTTKNVILSPDGITENTWYTDKAGSKPSTANQIVLSKDGNFFKNWSIGSAGGSSYTTTVTYVEATGYTKFIKYYPSDVTSDTDAETKALANQPKDESDFNTNYKSIDPKIKIRKAQSALYTNYKNLTLVANYDTSKTFLVEIDDVSLYELKPTYFGINFKKDGTAVTDSGINYNGTVLANTITDLKLGGTDTPKKVLEVSVSKVNNIGITVNDTAKIPVTTYNAATNTIDITDGTYDKIHLVVKAIDGNTILVDQDWDAQKSWSVNFKTWKLGKYHCELTANTNQMPGITYSYVFTLNITQ